MSDGNVKWFNPRKGYGFIATSDGRDIFVHYSSISGDGYRTLAEGDPVTFDIVEGEKGLRAENVLAKPASESEKESSESEKEPSESEKEPSESEEESSESEKEPSESEEES